MDQVDNIPLINEQNQLSESDHIQQEVVTNPNNESQQLMEVKLQDTLNKEILHQQSEQLQDYWKQAQLGNFGLVLQLIDQVDLEALDQQGYGLIHYAATYNNLETLKILRNHRVNPDLLSNTKQTALIIACSYGFIECAKLLIDQNSNINHIDNYKFSPIFYAIRGKHYSLTLYLLCKGAQLQGLSDGIGCSTIHWAAYNDDVWMLHFLKAVGVEFDLCDSQGFTPLSRACSNFSYSSVKYLVNTFPALLSYPVELGSSKELRNIISQQIKIQELQRIRPYMQLSIFCQKNWNLIISALYLLLTLSMVFSFSYSTIFQDASAIDFVLNSIFIMMLLYFGLFAVWFANRATSSPDQGKILFQKSNKIQQPSQENDKEIELSHQQNLQIQEEESKMIQNDLIPENHSPIIDNNQNMEFAGPQPKIRRITWYERDLTPPFLAHIQLKHFFSISYKPVEYFINSMKNIPTNYIPFAEKIGEHQQEINELIEIKDPLWYQGFTIVHIIYYLYETNSFVALHNIKWQRVCPTCLAYKPPRTFHCTKAKKCVEDYHGYSQVFQKCLNSTNHLFYFGFQTLSLILYFYYVWSFWSGITPKVTARWYFTYPLEILVRCYINDGFFIGSTLVLIVFIYLCTLITWIIEVLCILLNVTYNEYVNSNRYHYLFEPKRSKQGWVRMNWRSRFPYGVMFNLVDYLANQVRNQRIV